MQKICLQCRVQELSSQPLAHLLPGLGLEVGAVTLVQTGKRVFPEHLGISAHLQ